MPKPSLSQRSLPQKTSPEKPSSKPASSKPPKSQPPTPHRPPTRGPATGAAEYPAYYAIIAQIPRGRVLTYGDVAALAGRPTSARRVGYALSALSAAKGAGVPWWRVVNARGEVSPRSGDLLGACELDQRAHLLEEGVELDAEGRLSLSRYRYTPAPRRSR